MLAGFAVVGLPTALPAAVQVAAAEALRRAAVPEQVQELLLMAQSAEARLRVPVQEALEPPL